MLKLVLERLATDQEAKGHSRLVEVLKESVTEWCQVIYFSLFKLTPFGLLILFIIVLIYIYIFFFKEMCLKTNPKLGKDNLTIFVVLGFHQIEHCWQLGVRVPVSMTFYLFFSHTQTCSFLHVIG